MAFRIPLIKPFIPERSKELVIEVLGSGFLTEGPVTRRFETACKDYIGCGHALAVTSCTTGLELALRALGVGPGDEVVIPDYTYPATADAVGIVGARAIIVDVDPQTLLIDYDQIEKAMGPKVKAIMPVSQFGNPLDYGRLDRIKAKWGVKIVEDAACALGSSYKGRKTGALADISVFSFHPRKFITSGEGGLVSTDDAQAARWMDSYKHFGLMSDPASREAAHFGMVGTNYKMSNILAAVALPQMEMIEELGAKRRNLAARYRSLLSGKPGILGFQETPEGGVHSYQTFIVFADSAKRTVEAMRALGVEAQIGTYCLHSLQAFAGSPSAFEARGSLRHSSEAFEKSVALPLFHEMTEKDQDEVVKALLSAVSLIPTGN